MTTTIEQVLEFKGIESAAANVDAKFDAEKTKTLAFAQAICGERGAAVLPIIAALPDGESLARSLRVLVRSILPRQFRIVLSDDEVVAAYTKAFGL